MKLFWKVMNTFVVAISSSPLHIVLSNNILVLQIKGIKTGKLYKIPVSYLEIESGKLCSVTDRENLWWRNLVNSQSTKVTHRGRLIDATLVSSKDDKDQIANYLDALCRHSRVDGFFAKVRYKNGEPLMNDIESAAQRMVAVTVSLHR